MSTSVVVAKGAGFVANHYVCTAGPRDRPFAEAHSFTSVALVLAGTFRYRAGSGHAALVPGAMMLGNAGQAYECSHEHGEGDRCLAFLLAPELVESVGAEVAPRTRPAMRRIELPAHPRSAALVARGRAALATPGQVSLEELAYDVAAFALAADEACAAPAETATDARRAAEAARFLDTHATSSDVALADLAAHVRVSPFHLLRTFRRVLGDTPHQYLIAARVARAAELLVSSAREVTDVAYTAGFGDLSHFIRSFRGATGLAPGAFRRAHRRS